jgi:hypothetical protein
MTLNETFPSPPPVETPSGAEALMRSLLQTMAALLAIIEQETVLVRAGHLRDAAQLEPAKSDFARGYIHDFARLSASQPALAKAAPELLDEFRERHGRFHDLLRINMTVLATAHAVSEDLIRGVSGELARRAAPQTYSASGRPAAPGASAIQPIAVSRML